MNYKIKIELKSDALIGSGEGFGAIIDTDVVFDEVGIPYIPGRRIKGCLRDSASEVLEMFEKSGIKNFIKINKKGNYFELIDKVFGTPEKPSCLNISNLTVEEYENNKKRLAQLIKKYPAILSKDEVISHFTSIRQQTKIDEVKGVAEEHSLRTVRAIKRGNVFEGDIIVDSSDNDILKLLWLACINLRHIGTKRNRGFGEIECKLLYGNHESKLKEFEKELESTIKN
jgi:CRISPR-associated protein Csx10